MGERLAALLTNTRPEWLEGCDVFSEGSRCPWMREGDTGFLSTALHGAVCAREES